MGALPKRKYASARQGKRRSHLHLLLPQLAPCPQCHSLRPSHRVCPVCGTYGGKQVIEVKSPAKRKEP
ncbi:MAG: 50S ribosomal protein L32 [Chloroflexi bacterium]|nr:50S ribosomal protein L32 [Chloroflexota bacterium]